MKYVLCSQSPRRRELLKLLIPDFDICISTKDEIIDTSLPPEKLTISLALQKLPDKRESNTVYIASDTIVAADNIFLGKPADNADAVRMLSLLSGKKHLVFTGIAAAYQDKIYTAYKATAVWFKPLTSDEISWYTASGEPFGKAGAYAIQGLGSRFIEKIEGCYFNVVGLPINCLYTLLKQNSLI